MRLLIEDTGNFWKFMGVVARLGTDTILAVEPKRGKTTLSAYKHSKGTGVYALTEVKTRSRKSMNAYFVIGREFYDFINNFGEKVVITEDGFIVHRKRVTLETEDLDGLFKVNIPAGKSTGVLLKKRGTITKVLTKTNTNREDRVKVSAGKVGITYDNLTKGVSETITYTSTAVRRVDFNGFFRFTGVPLMLFALKGLPKASPIWFRVGDGFLIAEEEGVLLSSVRER